MTRFSTMWSAGSSPTSWALNLRHTFASRPSCETVYFEPRHPRTMSRDIATWRRRCWPIRTHRSCGPGCLESSNKGNRSEGVPLGFASTGPDAVGFYEQCGFPALHRTLARVGSRMRPIQALYSAGGDADFVRELSVTATGRCSANDRSATAATRAVIRPSSR
jgi:hypothetical protein